VTVVGVGRGEGGAGVGDGGIGVAVGSGVEDGAGLVAVDVREARGEGVTVGAGVSVGVAVGSGVFVGSLVGCGVGVASIWAVGTVASGGVQLVRMAKTDESSAMMAQAWRRFLMSEQTCELMRGHGSACGEPAQGLHLWLNDLPGGVMFVERASMAGQRAGGNTG
jgi:hypothetical protein